MKTPLRQALAAAGVLAATAALVALARVVFPPPGAGAGQARGQEVFWGRGRCASCHALGEEGGGIRCPDLGPTRSNDEGGGQGEGETLLARAARRVPGMPAAEYLVQSLLEPDAYVVPGFPRGLMPAVHLPPVSLDEDDVVAVFAYLTRGAVDPRAVRLAFARRRPAATPSPGVPSGDAVRGRRVYEEMKCAACHVIEGITLPEDEAAAQGRGPVLTGIGAVQSLAYLEESVWEPDAVLVPGERGQWLADDHRTSRMPSYRETMTRAELDDLVAFLRTLR